MCVYIYLYTCIHTYTHTYKYTQTCTHTGTLFCTDVRMATYISKIDQQKESYMRVCSIFGMSHTLQS